VRVASERVNHVDVSLIDDAGVRPWVSSHSKPFKELKGFWPAIGVIGRLDVKKLIAVERAVDPLE
jgi:hypothetical protein